MEEKENLEKGIRKVGKTAKKILRNPILRKAVIVLAVFVIIIIALGGAFDALMDGFSNLVSDHVQNTPVKYNKSDYSINIEDETVQGLIKMMEKKGIKVANLGLKEEDIKKIYAAEVVSSEINLNVRKVNGKDEFTKQDPKKYYGRVFIEREGANGNLERLKYVPDINEFKNMSSPEILRCFSIDEEGKLCVASTYEKTDGSGKVIESNISFNTLNYKDNIAAYTVPVEFLLDLCVITQNPGFIMEFADKIINETEIVIQILQDKTVTRTDKTITYDEVINESVTTQTAGVNSGTYKPTSQDKTEEKPQRTVEGKETTTEIETRISSRIKIKSVENWIMKEVYTYNKVGPATEENTLPPESLKDGEVNTNTTSTGWQSNRNGATNTTTITTTQRVNQKLNTKITTTTTTYQQGVSEEGVQDKVEDFVKLLKTPFKNPGTNMKDAALGKLDNGAGIFFNMLKNGERTQNLEDLMRYILYKATGDKAKYKITKFDFDIFKIKDFNTIGASALLKEYIRYWEAGGNAKTNADGTKYIILDDGAGNAAVGYGVDIENSGYKAAFIAAGYPTNIGGEVPVEFVDSLENMILGDKARGVESYTSGLDLTGYQKNALISRAYNMGTAGACGNLYTSLNFAESYEKYWKQETDDMFEEKKSNANFSHKLYINYMSKVTSSNGQYMYGLERRRKSEWTLFQTGYYDVLNKWHRDASLVDAAYEVADHFRNGVNVHYAGDSVPEAPDNGRQCVFGNIQGAWDYPVQNSNKYGVVCATYVSLALWRSGIIDEATINSIGYNGCTDLQRMLTSGAQKDRWQKITSVNDLQEGDIVFHTNYDHVLIYVGDGKCIDQNYCTITSRGNDYRGNLVGVGSFLEAYRFIGK